MTTQTAGRVFQLAKRFVKASRGTAIRLMAPLLRDSAGLVRFTHLALAGSARRWRLRLEGGRWEGPARSMGRCCFHAGVCVWRCVSVFRLARVVVCGCACVSCDPSCSCCLAWFQVTEPFGGASGEGQYHPAGLVGTVGASCVLWGASGRRLCGWAQVNHSCWRTCTSQHGWGRWREDWDVRVAGS